MDLLGLAWPSSYCSLHKDDRYKLRVMALIDEQLTRTPFCGVERIAGWFHRQGEEVNRTCVPRLLRLMGVETLDPKPLLSL